MRFRQLVVQVLRVNLQQTQSQIDRKKITIQKQRNSWCLMFFVWLYDTLCCFSVWKLYDLIPSDMALTQATLLALLRRLRRLTSGCSISISVITSEERLRQILLCMEFLCFPFVLTCGAKAGRMISWIENSHINWLSRSLLFASQENMPFFLQKEIEERYHVFMILQFYIPKFQCFNSSAPWSFV